MTVNGFTNLYLLTLEKRFQLTSTQVGFVAASNDIAGILITALVSFYGTYRNKIKFLGYGSLLTGLTCFLYDVKSKNSRCFLIRTTGCLHSEMGSGIALQGLTALTDKGLVAIIDIKQTSKRC